MVICDNTQVLMYRNAPANIKNKFKPIIMNKIAFCGSSGCGKTTMAKTLSEKLELPYISMSQRGMFSAETIEKFKAQTNNNYKPENSHQMIIYLSNRFPHFGIDFQFEVMRARLSLIETNEKFITDRSPVDNMVYFMAQVGSYATEPQTKAFLNLAIKAFNLLDAVVLLSPNPKGEIEDDKSRIINPFYQEYIHYTFESTLRYFQGFNPKILYIRDWDLKTRIDLAMNLLKT